MAQTWGEHSLGWYGLTLNLAWPSVLARQVYDERRIIGMESKKEKKGEEECVEVQVVFAF